VEGKSSKSVFKTELDTVLFDKSRNVSIDFTMNDGLIFESEKSMDRDDIESHLKSKNMLDDYAQLNQNQTESMSKNVVKKEIIIFHNENQDPIFSNQATVDAKLDNKYENHSNSAVEKNETGENPNSTNTKLDNQQNYHEKAETPLLI